MTYEEKKAAWEKRQDALDALDPERKREPFPGDKVSYGSMAFTLLLLTGGMTACVIKHYGHFPWPF